MKYKLIIIGSGPAGYTAALYASRAKLKPLVLAGEISGGQLMNTTMVENWPGVEKTGMLGPELMVKMRQQAEHFGAEIIDKKAVKVDFSGRVKKVWTEGNKYEAEAVIIATGAEPIKLGVPGEDKFYGRGVSVCAVCDAPFYKDKTVYVIGGGDAACEDALALSKHTDKVYLVHRRDTLRASKIMVERVKNNKKIKILWNTELAEIKGKDKVEQIVLNSPRGRGGETKETDGVFLAIGHKPVTEIFKNQIELDKKGYIKTKMSLPQATQTSAEGVFAAGDVVDFVYQQAITAAGMGCMAALDVEKWLEKRSKNG